MRHSNMRPLLLWCVAVVVVWPAAAEQPVTGGDTEPDRDRITQVSVINALLLGQFDGRVPFAGLLADGDFGLGTLDRLDGELVVPSESRRVPVSPDNSFHPDAPAP